MVKIVKTFGKESSLEMAKISCFDGILDHIRSGLVYLILLR